MADHVVEETVVTGASEGVLASDQLKVVEDQHRKSMAQSVREDGLDHNGEPYPTEEDYATLRKVAVRMPNSAYLLCFMEFAERASYYGVTQVFSNFVRAPLPAGGNGAGAPARGTQDTAGALGKGSVVASAVVDSFKFLAYGLPIFAGWMADTRWGRFKTIWIGVGVFGLAHIIMVIAAIPSVLQSGNAFGPFMLSVYLLSVGAALFKPNIAPTLLDQNPLKHAVVRTTETGERVIADPETTNESVMLWFYLLINIGAFFGVATSYLAKYVGFWASYLLPGLIYFFIPPLLVWLKPRLRLQPPGGSDLSNVVKVVGIAIAKRKFGVFKPGGLNAAKPSVLAASGDTRVVSWDDKFVDDVTRTFQACGIFLFYPIFYINDGALGAAANAQSAALTTNGVPNDLINNFNPLAIIIFIPILNHVVYPFLSRSRIRFGPIRRITAGFFLCAIGSLGFTIIQYYVYKTSPCGNRASTCTDDNGNSLVSPVSLWFTVIPVGLTAMAEPLAVVTSYGVAYTRSPPNMKSLVMALNLFTTAIASAISLATADAIRDPFLLWAFAGPTIVGFVFATAFWILYRDLDKEEYTVHLWDDTPAESPSGGSEVDLSSSENGAEKVKGKDGLETAAAVDEKKDLEN